jgi:hypothetical protein
MKPEEEFLNQVQLFLEARGCTIFREIVPDECFAWEKPYRVDMIIFREDIGYIGIEGKYLNTLGQGAILAQASEQIKKYRGLTYFKGLTKIKRWAILPRYSSRFEGREDLTTLDFISSFFKYYEIDIATFYENKWGDNLSIGANFPNNLMFNKWRDGKDDKEIII